MMAPTTTTSAEMLLALLAADGDAIVLRDGSGRSIWANDACRDVLGWHAEEFVLVSRVVSHPDDQSCFDELITSTHSRPGHHHLGLVRILGADGEWRRTEVTVVNLLDDHGVVVVRHRSLEKRAPMGILPVTDDVTGLVGRTAIQDALESRLDRPGAPVAVLFLDLDGFKGVNDRFGHRAGDAVLREVVQRLQSRLRPSELLGRWGGDEFVVLVDVPGLALATTVAARLHSAVTSEPFVVDGEAVVLGMSIGVALGGVGGSGADLVHAADDAMYVAKRGGGGVAAADAA